MKLEIMVALRAVAMALGNRSSVGELDLRVETFPRPSGRTNYRLGNRVVKLYIISLMGSLSIALATLINQLASPGSEFKAR
jgi:hypothetical protein